MLKGAVLNLHGFKCPYGIGNSWNKIINILNNKNKSN